MSDLDTFGDQIAALEATLEGAQGIAAAFDGELGRMRETMLFAGREVNVLSSSIGGGLKRAFDGLVFDGQKLSDVLGKVAKSMVDAVYSTALRPVQNALGGLVSQGIQAATQGLSPFAKGGSFAQGRVMPFAQGGVVTAPTPFGMRGGLGLMGEAGPEAIMPLARGADGRLGVRTSGQGARAVNVVMNITTPDAQGFQRSQAQIAAEVSRALGRGTRNR